MLILASKSPRRKELLSFITNDFEIIPAVGEENADPALSPDMFVQELAKQKALEIAASRPDDIVIGSDTVVAAKGEILGKPADADDAYRMLAMLSGTSHSVFTGVAVVKNGEIHSFTEETKVKFFSLSEKEIRDYIATGEPFDKAGAYGIQEIGALLVEGIDGDYYNVMGLPVGRLYRLMKSLSII
ncbi:MAG: septum formation inhibitor Maf [Ruminiclostridium sp.]|nr:septum formation inhibitor Maf [Ruminiclostridium sp.]